MKLTLEDSPLKPVACVERLYLVFRRRPTPFIITVFKSQGADSASEYISSVLDHLRGDEGEELDPINLSVLVLRSCLQAGAMPFLTHVEGKVKTAVRSPGKHSADMYG